jgi:hypothetical protein
MRQDQSGAARIFRLETRQTFKGKSLSRSFWKRKIYLTCLNYLYSRAILNGYIELRHFASAGVFLKKLLEELHETRIFKIDFYNRGG